MKYNWILLLLPLLMLIGCSKKSETTAPSDCTSLQDTFLEEYYAVKDYDGPNTTCVDMCPEVVAAAQALLAAKAGASFISPFVGRLDDIGEKGMDLIEDIVIIYENYGFDTEVLVASIRTTQHVIDAALIGAHVSTVPPQIIHELYKHNLTDKGLKAFLDDWAKTGQSILPI